MFRCVRTADANANFAFYISFLLHHHVKKTEGNYVM